MCAHLKCGMETAGKSETVSVTTEEVAFRECLPPPHLCLELEAGRRLLIYNQAPAGQRLLWLAVIAYHCCVKLSSEKPCKSSRETPSLAPC